LWGLFILDDHANLEGLEQIQHFSLSELFQFITTGISSRLGRPVSLTSFALQFYGWPHSPYIFKHANLMIHLLNGVLVFWLTLKLLELSQQKAYPSLMLALCTATVWMLHPLQVSTVSYVIQRMTELSALFSFATIITYLHGRQLALSGKNLHGLIVMSIAMIIGMPLAILSKENGVLIPIFIGAIEYSLLNHIARPRHWRLWALVFLALPLVLLLSYFGFNAQSLFIQGFNGRDFTLVERLLTESRILFDYLRLCFFPLPSDLGLFFDDYPISKSLLIPFSTLLSLLGLATLCTGAFLLRSRHPMFSFAVFWFLGGHLLESTALPLELFFLHRNYVPLLGPILAAVYYCYALISHIQHRWIKQYVRLAAISMITVFALITYSESIVWGNTLSQAKVWSEENPSSKRSLNWYASTLIMQHKAADARKIYLQKAKQFPQDSAPYLRITKAACYDPDLSLPDTHHTLRRLRNSPRYETPTLNLMIILVRRKEEGKCPALPLDRLLGMIDALSNNHQYQGVGYKLLMLKGRVFNMQGKYWLALSEYDRSYEIKPSLPTLLDMLQIAAQAGRTDLVERFVKRAKEDPKLSIVQKTAYRESIHDYEMQLAEIFKNK
jgi:hypothetical protein